MITLALGASGLVVVSGCGGSSSSSRRPDTASPAQSQGTSTAGNESTATALSRAQLIVQADAVCRGVNRQLAATTVHSSQELVTTAPRIVALELSGVEKLKKLVAPAELRSDWAQIVSGMELVAHTMKKYGEYVASNQLKTASAILGNEQQRRQQTLSLARRDGFKNCGRL